MMRVSSVDLAKKKTRSILSHFKISPDKYFEVMDRKGYHNFNHVAYLLMEFENYRRLAKDEKAIELAILFHDYCYYPGCKDNEQDSVNKLHVYCPNMHMKVMRYIERLILESQNPTQTDYEKATDVEKDILLFHDLDFSILGSDTKTYVQYAMNVYLEYADVYDFQTYRDGRIKFLENMLKRPNIFYVREFQVKFDGDWRSEVAHNIRVELNWLKGINGEVNVQRTK